MGTPRNTAIPIQLDMDAMFEAFISVAFGAVLRIRCSLRFQSEDRTLKPG